MAARPGRSALAGAGLGTLVATAAASSLGTLAARSLVATDWAAHVAVPAIVGCDNFAGPTGSSLDGRAAVSGERCAGRAWRVHDGTWTIQADQAASSTAQPITATLDTASADATVMVTITNVDVGRRSAGVVASHGGAATYLAAVLIDGRPDRVELRHYVDGRATTLASAAVALSGANTVAMVRAGSSVSVELNGSAVLAVTLTPTQQAALGSSGRAGLFGASHTNVRFDDLVVTVP